jgi:hypothetical protein
VIARSRQTVVDGLLVVAVFATAFFYRFNTLGGALGGFTNDEFGYLARGRQIQSGELPFRDFNDPGWILTDTLSGAAQWLGGYNLRSEALLTIGMLSLGAAITFVLARRAAGSTLAALLAIVVHIALDARHYNYPKIVLYAAGIALAWSYVDWPRRGRLAALGALLGIAFLFRHDNIVYLGAFILLTIGLVHRKSMRDALVAVAGAGAVAAALIAPFLLFLALNGGVTEYFRAALVYVARDAERTSFSLPRLSLDPSRPLVAWSSGAPAAVARVNVRWSAMPDAERRAREARYRLEAGERVDGTTWSYVLADASRRNIQALIADPRAEDTHGLDRINYTIARTPASVRLETQLDTVPNATAFLYYTFLSLPLLSAVVLWRLRRVTGSTRVLRDPEFIVPLLVLAALLNIGFMSRGSTNIRIADVGVTAAMLLAWLSTALMSGDGRVVLPTRAGIVLARASVIVVLGLTVLSANGLAQGARTARDAGLVAGPAEVVTRARGVWDRLGVDPAALAGDREQPAILRIAAYVRACTRPDDRLFVLGEYPLLYYFSNRLFAGGHAWLLPLYYTGEADEARIVARLTTARVPIVITEDRAVYEEDYRPVFERVHAHLEREYREAGEIEVDGRRLRVLARADLQPVGRYQGLGLPCFAGRA